MNESGASESLYGSEPPPVPGKAPGLMEQILGVFTEPTALFKRLAVTPVWGGAFALIAVFQTVMTVLWAFRVDVDAMLRPVFERDPRIPADKIDSIIAMQGKMMIPFSFVSGAVVLALICLVMALLYWLVGKGTAEGQPPTYRKAFSACVVSGLVMLPRVLLMTIVCGLRNFGGAKPDELSPTSLGFYVAPEAIKLHAFYNTLDLFNFASLFLIFLAMRHTLRLKVAGAAICTLIAAVVTFGLPVFFAR